MRNCIREVGSWQLMRPVGHIISSVFHAGDATTAVVMYHAACEMLEGCCPRAERVLEEAEPDALAYGSVGKVGVAPDPKRVGPASRNLEYG